MFEEGKAYLICLGFGWVMFGRAVRPLGIFAWEFEHAGYVVNTGGTPWGELAAGKGRDKANLKPIGAKGATSMIGTQIQWAQVWTGTLPGEKKVPGE